MRKKTLRTFMCSFLSIVVMLASMYCTPVPVEAKGSTATIPITVGGKTFNVTPGQWVTVNTPGGTTSYNVRFVNGKPVALEMQQYQQIIFGDAGSAGATQTSGSTTQTGSSKPSTSGSASQNSGSTAQTGSNSSSSSSSAAQTSGSTAAQTPSSSNNGQMTWNEFQKANSGKGMSSSEMSKAWNDYKAGNTGNSSAAQTGTNSNTPTPQASVAEGANTSTGAAQTSTNNGASNTGATGTGAGNGTSVADTSSTSAQTSQTNTSNWDPTKHPRDPQTGKFISHEEAIARGLMDPADATTTSSGSSQTAQASEGANQTAQTNGGTSAEGTQASTDASQASGPEVTQTAQATEGAATSGEKGKTTIGDKFKAGYETGKNLTNQGFQNVKDSLKSGFSAKNILVTAGITVGVDLATQVMRGENPSLKTALKTVCCAEFAGSVVGSTLGAAAGSFFTPFLSCVPVVGGVLSALAPTFGSIVGSSAGAYLAGDLKNGRFSIKEAFKRIDWVGVTGQTIGSTAGAALGSFLGPVGTVVGGMVGGYFGNWAAHKIAGLFGKGEANLPVIAMPTGKTGSNSVTPTGAITLGGSNATVTISDEPPVVAEEEEETRSREAGNIDENITAAYQEYTKYYDEYSKLIKAGKTAEALEVAKKMNEAKARYDSLRYE